MSVSDLSFSASLPPFNYTSGAGNNFSNTNLAVSGTLSVATGNDSANGANTPTVQSSATENGVNFVENSASFNGNLLTVNYLSSNATGGGAQDSGSIAGPLNVNINGNGIGFSPQSSHGTGAAVTTTYSTTPNSSYNNAVQGAAISTGSSTDNENYTLKSLALVGNSLIATYQITNSPPTNQAALTPDSVSAVSGVATSSSPSAINTDGSNFTSRGISSIGQVLANDDGLDDNGTLTNALQQPPSIGSATGYPNAGSVLAATLDPGIDLSPNTSLQVTDFLNTSLNAFPNSAPASVAPTDNSNNAAASSGNAISNSFGAGNAGSASGSDGSNSTSNSSGFGSGNNASPGFGSSSSDAAGPVGIYSAISNSNASTIRGAGVDTVA